jgi:hypothetical protein
MTIKYSVASDHFHCLYALSVAFVGVMLFGCGSYEARGRVVGKVTFQGKVVSEGQVIFSNQNKGIHITTELKPEGSYEVRMAKGVGLPIGTYSVCVCPPPLVPKGVFDPMTVEPYSNIPEKYRDASTSGLTLTVKEGENPFDIAMQP